MRRLLIPLSGTLLAAFAWAQDTPASREESAADKAAKAMAAMDEIAAPSATAPAKKETPSAKSASAKPTKPETGAAKAPNADDGPDAVTPPLLPPTAPARGIDLLTRSRLDMMVPAGRSHRGVHYPMYQPVETDRNVLDPVFGGIAGVKAPLASLFESDLVTRLDDDHVQFDRAKFVQFEETPTVTGEQKPTMKLEIERGVYDLKNEILMTNQPVRIENQQFVIEGDTMLHDRASGLTRLTGRVKMTFYNEEPAPADPASPAPSDSPAPAAPTPAPGSQPSR